MEAGAARGGTSDAGRKHRFTIIFDGVIAVGPPYPLSGAERQGPFFGVMARSTRRISNRSRRLKEIPPVFIPMHVPTIYTIATPLNDSRLPDQVFKPLPNGPEWFIWQPVRERLEFRFDGNGTPGPLTYDKADHLKDGGPFLSGVKTHSIKKVPDGRAIWPERGELVEGLMSAETPVRDEAQTQVLVPWGDVVGSGIFDKEKGVDVVFDPKRGSSGSAQNVVPNAAVIVEAQDVEIAAYSMDTGERLDSIKFRLDKDAELWVSNGDPSDTAIDLKKLTDVLSRRNEEDERNRFRDLIQKELENVLRVSAQPSDLEEFTARVFTGGGGAVKSDVLDERFIRKSKVDLDFELFYGIMRRKDLEQDGLGLPVPVKADGTVFEGPNCLIKQLECRDALFLKSNG